ncbi:MAG: polysaccharide deacetylase family protein [Acidobacteriota bacterium]|jgi:polysaccharide deacetylase family protein (PEP-CTERM system associated)
MRSAKSAPNFLTFDVEEWYMANYDSDVFSRYPAAASRIEWETDRLLAICDETGHKATCFCVGRLAQERPEIIRKFHRQGHEIASHGYSHGLVYRMTPEAFKADLNKSIRILEDCTGGRIKGFRAPSWSVTAEILPWFYRILEEAGIEYSSSVYPAWTYLFGIPGFPERIHRPQVGGQRTSVYEVPQVLTSFLGQKVGFSGGFFLRFFPTWFIKSMLSRKNHQGMPAFIYVHPREIDPKAGRLPLKRIDRLVHYWNVAGTEAKLRKILACDRFEFLTIGAYLRRLEAQQ